MVSERVDELIKMVSLLKRDAEKCDSGNVSAGTRVRKDLMRLIRDMKELRQSVLEQRKEKV
jgi:ribosome biogenesis protein Tsr3